MHVLVLAGLGVPVPAERVPEVLEAHGNFVAVVEQDVGKSGRVDGKEEEVDNQVSRRQVSRRVGLVLFSIEQTLLVDSAGDVVVAAGIIEDAVRVDGEVAGVVRVGPPDTDDNEEGAEHSQELVEGTEEGNHERVSGIEEQDVPVESGPRVETETVLEAGDVAENHVVGGNPRKPAKGAKSNEDVVGEPEVDEHGQSGVQEEGVAGHGEHLLEGAKHRHVCLGVEGIVESNGDERGGPDAVAGINEETASQAGHAVTDQVGGEGDQNLVAELASVGLVEVLGKVLRPDNVVGVGGAAGDVGHDGDEHVLLAVEGAGVEAVASAKEGETNIREDNFADLAERECQQLGDVEANGNGRHADGEELVDGTESTREDDTNNPGTDGGGGHAGIIMVVDDGTDFGVGRVVADEGGLNLHLVDDVFVLFGILQDALVAEEFLDLGDDGMGEVGIAAVDLEDLLHEAPDFLERHAVGEGLGLEEILLGDIEFTVVVVIVVSHDLFSVVFKGLGSDSRFDGTVNGGLLGSKVVGRLFVHASLIVWAGLLVHAHIVDLGDVVRHLGPQL